MKPFLIIKPVEQWSNRSLSVQKPREKLKHADAVGSVAAVRSTRACVIYRQTLGVDLVTDIPASLKGPRLERTARLKMAFGQIKR